MDETTREALEGSIKKWEAIVAGIGRDEGPSNCPLCHLFWHAGRGKCLGCPVRERTGKGGCSGTPYDDYEIGERFFGWDSPEAKKHAVLELEFLKSLRPSDPLPSDK